MTNFLTGAATALVTPFQDKSVNFEAYGNMIDYQLENGISALVVLGTTGEPATMSEEEKTALIEFAIKYVNGRAKVIVGTGCNNTEKAAETSKRAESLGADGVLAVTPYYNKCTQNGLYLYYKTICEAVHIPVICYNVPTRTGVNILPETMARIADIPNIAGIKEASGNMAQVLETARLIRGKCDLYSGEDALNFPILAAGGTAVISVVSNLAPKGVSSLCRAVLSGDLQSAIEWNDALLPLTKACFLEVNPIPVKAGLNALGLNAGAPRAPLTPMEEDHERSLIKAMKEYGLKVTA